MTPVGPLKFKRTPQAVRRRIEVAGAAAWEAIVLAHSAEALRFADLMAGHMTLAAAVDRYLDEMDVRDPMASAIRSRALTSLRSRKDEEPGDEADAPGDPASARDTLRRLRPDRVVKGIARRVRENEAVEETVRLAIARAEETILTTHIDGAVGFGRLLRENQGLDEAVEDYIELMRITGGRAQAVYQRAMARLADLYLPDGEGDPDADADDDDAGPIGLPADEADEHLGI